MGLRIGIGNYVASCYDQAKIVRLLLNFGARTDIKINFGYFPIDEAMTKEITQLLKENEKDCIGILYRSLLNKKIANTIFPLYFHGKIIEKK